MNDPHPSPTAPWIACGWLAGATVAAWLALAGPAWGLAGTAGLEGLTWAAALCLVPGLAVVGLASLFRSAEAARAFVVLGGAGLRLLFVLGGMFVVQSARGHLGFREFVVWLLAFYLAMLAVETLLVVRTQPE